MIARVSKILAVAIVLTVMVGCKSGEDEASTAAPTATGTGTAGAGGAKNGQRKGMTDADITMPPNGGGGGQFGSKGGG